MVSIQKNLFDLEQLKAIAAIATSLLILGIAPVFIKLVEGELTPSATIFNRLWGGAVIFGLWSGLSRIKKQKENSSSPQEITKIDYLLLFCASFFFWTSQTAWAWSLPRTEVAISDLLHNFIPIFVVVGSWLLGRERFTFKFVIGTGLSIIGSCLIGIEHLSSPSHQIQGDLAAILSAAFMGVYILAGETLCDKFSKITIMFCVCATGTILSIPVLFTTQMQWFPLSSQGWICAICLMLSIVLGQGLMLYGIEKVGGSLMSVLSLLDPLIAAIAAWFVFAEILSNLDWVAMVIVLVGVYLAISDRSPSSTSQSEFPEEVISNL
ncbi:MAG: DMT family transporter [Cyanobacteria bacterium SBLK]|nr:DMT family transporter [Cyanobacteria bacterium SBLK]